MYCIFCGAPRVLSEGFQGENPMFGLYLLYLAIALSIVLETRTFSGMKIQDIRSDNHNAYTLFSFSMRCFWRIYFVVKVLHSVLLRVLLLRAFHHRAGMFVFFFLSFLCSSWLYAFFDVFGGLVGWRGPV
jgi:hypothetical protein